MDNPEEVMQILERFNVNRAPEISSQLEEYITFVARTGDSVYPWSLVKNLFREKLVHVITEFYNETPTKELPQYPNVDPFNYETMKKMLIEKLDSFSAAPFTIQRISELLSDPRKQYSRVDKFMRAVEKTILVVSTVPPGRHRSESENGDSLDSALNGDFASEVNVDIDMEQDGTFTASKETTVVTHRKEQNHDVSSINHETITIKKSEPEAGTSEEKVATEVPKEPVTDVTIETVSITVIEPDGTAKESEAVAVEIPPASDIQVQDEATSTEISVVKETPPSEPVIQEISPVVTSADDEILVDTSEIISDTPPLAALENIVAIRTEAAAVEVAEPIIKATELEPATPVEETPAPAAEEETEIDSKRARIEEVEVPIAVEPVAAEVPVIEETPVAPVEPEIPAPIEQQPATIAVEEQIPEIPVEQPIEAAASEPIQPIVEKPAEPEEIDEPLPAVAEIPIEIVPTEDITEAPATEMETIPTIPTENTMSLDEDEPPAIEQEMTPIASKMDTDEVEAAPMDFEDDAEPMDQ